MQCSSAPLSLSRPPNAPCLQPELLRGARRRSVAAHTASQQYSLLQGGRRSHTERCLVYHVWAEMRPGKGALQRGWGRQFEKPKTVAQGIHKDSSLLRSSEVAGEPEHCFVPIVTISPSWPLCNFRSSHQILNDKEISEVSQKQLIHHEKLRFFVLRLNCQLSSLQDSVRVS